MTATVVIEVAPQGESRRYFVPSASIAGAFWMVRYTPGKSLTCSCPHGRRIAAAGIRVPSPRPCHHLKAVIEWAGWRVGEAVAEVGERRPA